jgi:hypothetical protein
MQANVSVHETDFPLLLRAREGRRHLLRRVSLQLAQSSRSRMSAHSSVIRPNVLQNSSPSSEGAIIESD